MNSPLISIIVPVYNVDKYLPRCIDSILTQTYTNLEIILIDDGSTDNSNTICDKYAERDKRIIVIHQKNQGVSNARNVGLKTAKGKFIGFVDADDFIEPDMYEYLYQLSVSFGTLLSVCNFTRVIRGLKKTMPPITSEGIMPANQALEKLHGQLFSCNKLFAKDLLQNIIFPLDITFGEDMIFCVKSFEKAQKIAYGPKSKYNYVENMSSATKKSFNPQKLTYFQVADYLYCYAIKHNLRGLQKAIKDQICYHAVGFLRQIARDNYQDSGLIDILLCKVRSGVFQYMLNNHKITNKFFALICCINFNLARKIYLFLDRRGYVK